MKKMRSLGSCPQDLSNNPDLQQSKRRWHYIILLATIQFDHKGSEVNENTEINNLSQKPWSFVEPLILHGTLKNSWSLPVLHGVVHGIPLNVSCLEIICKSRMHLGCDHKLFLDWTKQTCDKQLIHEEYNARVHTWPRPREIWRDEMCIIQWVFTFKTTWHDHRDVDNVVLAKINLPQTTVLSVSTICKTIFSTSSDFTASHYKLTNKSQIGPFKVLPCVVPLDNFWAIIQKSSNTLLSSGHVVGYTIRLSFYNFYRKMTCKILSNSLHNPQTLVHKIPLPIMDYIATGRKSAAPTSNVHGGQHE